MLKYRLDGETSTIKAGGTISIIHAPKVTSIVRLEAPEGLDRHQGRNDRPFWRGVRPQSAETAAAAELPMPSPLGTARSLHKRKIRNGSVKRGARGYVLWTSGCMSCVWRSVACEGIKLKNIHNGFHQSRLSL